MSNVNLDNLDELNEKAEFLFGSADKRYELLGEYEKLTLVPGFLIYRQLLKEELNMMRRIGVPVETIIAHRKAFDREEYERFVAADFARNKPYAIEIEDVPPLIQAGQFDVELG